MTRLSRLFMILLICLSVSLILTSCVISGGGSGEQGGNGEGSGEQGGNGEGSGEQGGNGEGSGEQGGNGEGSGEQGGTVNPGGSPGIPEGPGTVSAAEFYAFYAKEFDLVIPEVIYCEPGKELALSALFTRGQPIRAELDFSGCGGNVYEGTPSGNINAYFGSYYSFDFGSVSFDTVGEFSGTIKYLTDKGEYCRTVKIMVESFLADSTGEDCRFIGARMNGGVDYLDRFDFEYGRETDLYFCFSAPVSSLRVYIQNDDYTLDAVGAIRCDDHYVYKYTLGADAIDPDTERIIELSYSFGNGSAVVDQITVMAHVIEGGDQDSSVPIFYGVSGSDTDLPDGNAINVGVEGGAVYLFFDREVMPTSFVTDNGLNDFEGGRLIGEYFVIEAHFPSLSPGNYDASLIYQYQDEEHFANIRVNVEGSIPAPTSPVFFGVSVDYGYDYFSNISVIHGRRTVITLKFSERTESINVRFVESGLCPDPLGSSIDYEGNYCCNYLLPELSPGYEYADVEFIFEEKTYRFSFGIYVQESENPYGDTFAGVKNPDLSDSYSLVISVNSDNARFVAAMKQDFGNLYVLTDQYESEFYSVSRDTDSYGNYVYEFVLPMMFDGVHEISLGSASVGQVGKFVMIVR